MSILKKIKDLLLSILQPEKYDDRIDIVIKRTEFLQKMADDSLKRAQMNGENKWFLKQMLEDQHKNDAI